MFCKSAVRVRSWPVEDFNMLSGLQIKIGHVSAAKVKQRALWFLITPKPVRKSCCMLCFAMAHLDISYRYLKCYVTNILCVLTGAASWSGNSDYVIASLSNWDLRITEFHLHKLQRDAADNQPREANATWSVPALLPSVGDFNRR